MVKIVHIERSGSKVCIELDNEEKAWITGGDLLTSSFTEEQQLEEHDFWKTIYLLQYPRALNQAVAMLARRPCSKKEIENKLIRNRYSSEIVAQVLLKLENENLINDAEFSVQWIRYRQNMNYGPARIATELRQKGVSEDDTKRAMIALEDSDYDHNALELAKKAWSRIRTHDNPYINRQKVIAALIRKGYHWGQAKKACEMAENEYKTTG